MVWRRDRKLLREKRFVVHPCLAEVVLAVFADGEEEGGVTVCESGFDELVEVVVMTSKPGLRLFLMALEFPMRGKFFGLAGLALLRVWGRVRGVRYWGSSRLNGIHPHA